MQFIVTVKTTDATGQTIIKDRTVIYTNTELEARVAGAAQLGVSQDAVTVTILGDPGTEQARQYLEDRHSSGTG